MADLRANVAGTVVEVMADEGRTLAEDDEVCAVETPDGLTYVRIETPGVVRELYVNAGDQIVAGSLVAFIDES